MTVTSKVNNVPSIPVSDLKYPTDYNLIKLDLLDSKGKKVLNLKPYLVEFNYFEDIFNNSISGKIVISDAVGNFDAFQGYEGIDLEFVRGIGGDTIRGTFFVFSASDRHYDKSNNFETYIINFCDEDMIMSERYRPCKSYKKFKISDIITDVLKNILKTPNDYDIEDTLGLYDLILPNRKIYETINWLTNYALPSGNKAGADMLFYENARGYHFNSLQTLYTQQAIATYYYSGKNVAPPSQKDFNYFNIYRLEILNNFDSLNGVMKGTYCNRLISFDPLVRKKYTRDFNYDNYFENSIKLNDNVENEKKSDKLINIPDVYEDDGTQESIYVDRFNKKLTDAPPNNFDTGARRLMLSNTTQLNEEYLKTNNKPNALINDIFVERYVPNRLAQLEMGTYIKIKITIPGNSDLIAGKVIHVRVHDSETETGKPKNDDDILSGNYLITAVRHIINTTRYITVVELSKDTRLLSDRTGAGSW